MKEYKSKEWLEDKYINRELSTYQIAKICGVSAEAVRYWLKKFKIAARPKNDYQKKLEKIKRNRMLEELLNNYSSLDSILSDYIERYGLI